MHCKLAVSACYLGNNIFTLTIEFANKKVLKTVVKNWWSFLCSGCLCPVVLHGTVVPYGTVVACGHLCCMAQWLPVASCAAWHSGCLWPVVLHGTVVACGQLCHMAQWLPVASCAAWHSGYLWPVAPYGTVVACSQLCCMA